MLRLTWLLHRTIPWGKLDWATINSRISRKGTGWTWLKSNLSVVFIITNLILQTGRRLSVRHMMLSLPRSSSNYTWNMNTTTSESSQGESYPRILQRTTNIHVLRHYSINGLKKECYEQMILLLSIFTTITFQDGIGSINAEALSLVSGLKNGIRWLYVPMKVR